MMILYTQLYIFKGLTPTPLSAAEADMSFRQLRCLRLLRAGLAMASCGKCLATAHPSRAQGPACHGVGVYIYIYTCTMLFSIKLYYLI